MKKSKKYTMKMKKRITLLSFFIVAILTTTLAYCKLTGFSALKIDQNISQLKYEDTITGAVIIPNMDTESISYLKGITVNGDFYQFSVAETNYFIELPYTTKDMLNIEYEKINKAQTISAGNQFIMTEDFKTINFSVISKDGSSTTYYTIDFRKEHTAYLSNIELPGYNLTPEFNPETLNYTIGILSTTTKVNISAVPYDKQSTVKIEGQNNVSIGSTIKLTVTNPYTANPVIYNIQCVNMQTDESYLYSGGYQEYTVQNTGLYRLECWGARGGYSRSNGKLGGYPGSGGYAEGEIALRKGEKLYVYVGEQGVDSVVGKHSAATWNGGGLGTWDGSDDETSGSGGGATDIRLVDGHWSDPISLASRIIVAGGGGGASWSYSAGAGGGLTGGSTSASAGGTQTSGYSFGIGRNGWGSADNDGVGRRRRRLLRWTSKQHI